MSTSPSDREPGFLADRSPTEQQMPSPAPEPLAAPTEFTSRRLVLLQVLRGVAALMVVIGHAIHQSPGFESAFPTEYWKQGWQAGVDLFFVISGFVMVYVTNKREQSPKQFLAMRAARIVPIYWFFTLASALTIIVAPQLYRANELSVKHLVLSMLFVPHLTASSGWTPLIKQGWTLNYEVFFYILFAIAMAISLRHRAALAVAALFTFAASGWALQWAGLPIGVLGFYFQPVILEFAFGMLIAAAFLRGKLDTMKVPVAGLLIVGGFVAMLVLTPTADLTNRTLIWGIPAAGIVVGALAFEHRVSLRLRLLQSIGDTSYSIYLVHVFPIAVLRAFWPLPMEGAVSLVLFLIATIVVVLLISRLSYTYVEQRSLKYLRGVIERRLG